MSTTATAVQGRAGVRNDATIPDGYKRTDVGVIPNDWEVKELSNIAILQRGRFSARPRNDPKFFGGDTPFIQTGDVSNSNGKITTFSQTLNECGLRVSKVFPSNTLFFTIAANIGDVAIAEFRTACPDSLIAVTPRSRIDKNWLFHTLRSQKKVFEGLATQNAQLNINLEKLKPYLLAVPAVPEQSAIAVALSNVDALIGTLDNLIAKQHSIKLATMQQLVIGKTRLAGFGGKFGYKPTDLGTIPADWKVCKISEIASVRTGPFGSSLHERDYVDEGTPIMTVEHLGVFGIVHSDLPMVSETDRHRLGAYSLEEGDIVLSRVGSVDRNALVRRAEVGWLFSGRLLRIRPNRKVVSPSFLSYHFHSEPFKARVRRVAVGQTMASLNSHIIGDVDVVLPGLSEQAAIAAVLFDMDAEIRALENQRDKTNGIKQGMAQALLTGRIRLVKARGSA